MPAVTYEPAQLWRPSNAAGMAVSFHGTVGDDPIVINLYWSGLLLATKGLGKAMVLELADGFIKNFIPRSEGTVQHYEYNGEEFRPIIDPRWVSGTEVF